MDRHLENDPRTERERRDGVRPEDQENEREKEQEQRRNHDPAYKDGEDRTIHPEFDEDNRDYPLEDPIDSPKGPL